MPIPARRQERLLSDASRPSLSVEGLSAAAAPLGVRVYKDKFRPAANLLYCLLSAVSAPRDCLLSSQDTVSASYILSLQSVGGHWVAVPTRATDLKPSIHPLHSLSLLAGCPLILLYSNERRWRRLSVHNSEPKAHLRRSSTKSILVPTTCMSAAGSMRMRTPACSTISSNLLCESA